MKKLLRCSLLGLLLLCSVVVNGAQVPKYIFLFIGDGMGFNHVEATQIYAEKVGTDTGECSLLFPTFPVMTQVCTRSASLDYVFIRRSYRFGYRRKNDELCNRNGCGKESRVKIPGTPTER